jgi:alginate O-acetyltransferase complex protein AlgI
MSVSSVEFILFVLVLAAIYPWVPGKLARQMLLALCNAVVLYWACFDSTTAMGWTLAILAAFLLSGYAMGKLLRRRPNGSLLAGYLIILICVFVYLKKYSFLQSILPASILAHPISIIGLSYMLFRQIHFLVDAMQGQIEAPSLWTYLNYQLNLTALLAGPIQRYQDFARYWDASELVVRSGPELIAAYQRIFWGVIKAALIGSLCMSVYKSSYATLQLELSGKAQWVVTRRSVIHYFVEMFYAYPAFVYFDFSGYCDIVIGAAVLLGMRLPENFNRPYLSRNTIDFWTRQHMTLSFWIRDYLFTPMYKAIVERRPSSAMPAAIGCYFVAFLVAGIWHGSTMNFVVFGLLHGAGVSWAKIWETMIIRLGGRAGLKRYLQLQSVRIAAIALTVNFICFTFIFFTPDLAQKFSVLRGVSKFI